MHVMKILLDGKKVSYDISRNGMEAKNLIQENLNTNKIYPLILSDINMPVMNGYELARWVRSVEFENGKKFNSLMVACSEMFRTRTWRSINKLDSTLL